MTKEDSTNPVNLAEVSAADLVLASGRTLLEWRAEYAACKALKAPPDVLDKLLRACHVSEAIDRAWAEAAIEKSIARHREKLAKRSGKGVVA